MNDQVAKSRLSDDLAALRGQLRTLKEAAGERDKTHDELNQVRQRYEYLLAVSPAIIYSTKASGDYACTFVSDNIRSIFGFAPDDMTTDAKCWPDRLHPDDAPRVFEELVPLVDSGGGAVEYRFRHSDGSYLWIQDTFKVIYDETDHPIELVGAWADVTKLKIAEQRALDANAELDDTKRSLSRLIESSPDAIISTNKAGKIELFNEGAEVLLGYQAAEVANNHVTLIYGGDAGFNELTREIRKRGGSISGFETVLKAKDGGCIPVLISASILCDDAGQEVGMVGFATDLRERQRAQETLRQAYDELEDRVRARTEELEEARARLQYLLKVTPGIIYTNKVSGDYKCTFVSQNVDPIMGFSAWEMLEDKDFWLNRLHPDDARRVFDEMQPLIDQGGGTIEYRFRHRDGHYVWIQDSFSVICDEAGHKQEIVGSWADISDRKEVEKSLGERVVLMNDLQNLVAASPSVIYTTKASGDFECTFVSENLKATMGYAPWEMRDDPGFWFKRLHPDDVTTVLEKMTPLIERGGGSIEYRFRHRKGHYLWVQDTFTVTRDEHGNPDELVGSWADISDRKHIEAEREKIAEQLELRNSFIRETFGRYLTDEVVANLLETATGLQIGGEKRKITMIMTDLRGFTSLSEPLEPQRVVKLLNRYLSKMVKIIKKYGGTIDEYIGDAVFVLFGAPIWREDDAQRAVACAVEMQLAMDEVNKENQQDDLPSLEMGIGIHTGKVVVGNIGSTERMKYGVVGSQVNLTSRIQSNTVGGQILISEATRREVAGVLRIGQQMEIIAKGFEAPVTLSEVLGIGRPYKLYLNKTDEEPCTLSEKIPLTYEVFERDGVIGGMLSGALTGLSSKGAEVRLEKPVPILADLRMRLTGVDGHEIPGLLYGKVVGRGAGTSEFYSVRFTTMPPEAQKFLEALLEQASEEPVAPESLEASDAPSELTLH